MLSRLVMRACGLVAVLAGGTLVLFASTTLAQDSSARVLAPGVLTVIPIDDQPGDTFLGPLPLIEVTKGIPDLEWTPNYLPPSQTLLAKSQSVIMRHEVWNLEFSFKPLRMIVVDIPQPSGRLEQKLVWYLVYRVRYLGGDLKPEPAQDEAGNVTYPSAVPVNYKSRRFFPHIVLQSHELNKSYLDRLLPPAQRLIEQRERVGKPLYNSVEITRVPIQISDDDNDNSVWGVATWTDLDPRIDFLSIYIQGLTNAYRFTDNPDEFQPGDPPGTGRTQQMKTLQLNFWRPGDSVLEHEDEIRYGVPIDLDPVRQAQILHEYGLTERLDYLWVYR